MLEWPQTRTPPATAGAQAGSSPHRAASKRAASARRQRALLALSGTVWRKQLQRIAAAPQVLRKPRRRATLALYHSATLVLTQKMPATFEVTAVLRQAPVGQPGSAAGAPEGGRLHAAARQGETPIAANDADCSRHGAAAAPSLRVSRGGLRSAGHSPARTGAPAGNSRPGTAGGSSHCARRGALQSVARSPARGAAPPAPTAAAAAPGYAGAGQKRRRAQAAAGKADTVCARTAPALRRSARRLSAALEHGGYAHGSEEPWRAHMQRPTGEGGAERPRSPPLPPPLELADQHAEVTFALFQVS